MELKYINLNYVIILNGVLYALLKKLNRLEYACKINKS